MHVKQIYTQSARSLIDFASSKKKAADIAKNCMLENNIKRFFPLNDGIWFDNCDGW